MNYFIWTSKAQEKCSLGVMVKGGLSNFGFHLFMVLENHDWQKHFLFYCFKLMISSYVPKALELNRTSLCHFKKDQVHTQGPWGTSGQFRHHPCLAPAHPGCRPSVPPATFQLSKHPSPLSSHRFTHSPFSFFQCCAITRKKMLPSHICISPFYLRGEAC